NDYGIAFNSPCNTTMNDCQLLIGALDPSCGLAIDSIMVNGEISNLSVVQQTPVFGWLVNDYSNSPQTAFEIAVSTDNDWQFAEMWNPAPFAFADTFVVYNGAPLLDGHTYWLRLRVSNSLGWSNWSEMMFRINSVPSAPQLRLPSNNSIVASQFPNLSLTLADNTPEFTWQSSFDSDPGDSIKFTLQLSIDASFSFASQIPGLTNPQYIPTNPLEWGRRYWWRVKAEDNSAGITWSNEVFSFATMRLGDPDGNGIVTISDAVFLINYIFSGGSAPNPVESGDADCNGILTISDAVYLVNYIFASGPPPCEL
ncbi:MAG: dockerin type I repeat-containing protein, partial [Candidatus Zixiibacteriota bacterium]